MPTFSDRSLRRLVTCHTDLQRLMQEVVKHYDVTVLCGHRTEEEQNEAFHTGRSTLRWPESKHNKQPSLAIDIAPWPVDWEDVERFRFMGGYVLATARQMLNDGRIRHTVRWGGDWDGDFDFRDQRFIDMPHFEFV